MTQYNHTTCLILIILALTSISTGCKNKDNEPVADFEAIPCDAPCGVVFSNKSQNAIAFKWDFGDGSTSLEDNPTHKYDKNGSYSVSLEANSSSGSSTIKKTITLNDTASPTVISARDGLVAYYTFEKNTKNIISDDFHGIVNNISFDSIPPSKKGYAAKFNAASISTDINFIYSYTNPFSNSNMGSICFWMKSHESRQQTIIHGESRHSREGFNIVIDKNIYYNQNIKNSSGSWVFESKFENYNTNKILDDKWHFITITIKPGEHKLYIDGALIQNKNTPEGMLGTNIDSGMMIGQFFYNTDWFLFQGSLDNLRLYNRVITSVEVQKIYNNYE